MFKFEPADTVPRRCLKWWLKEVGAKGRELFLTAQMNLYFRVIVSGRHT